MSKVLHLVVKNNIIKVDIGIKTQNCSMYDPFLSGWVLFFPECSKCCGYLSAPSQNSPTRKVLLIRLNFVGEKSL